MTENTKQADYWASASGAKWVDHEESLDTMLQPVLDRLLLEAKLRTGERVLDIGCGTGASTLAAADLVGPNGIAIGADISPVMLNRAHERAEGLSNASFIEADAQTYAFEPGSFDAIISRFGVMFFSDPVAAFANMAKTLSDDGRLICLAWGPLADNPWFALPRKVAIDRLGQPAPADPSDPGPMAFADRDYVSNILKNAGLSEISVDPVSLYLSPMGSLPEIARFAVHLGPASRIVIEKDGTDADTTAIADDIEQGLKEYNTPEGPRIPALLNLITARKE